MGEWVVGELESNAEHSFQIWIQKVWSKSGQSQLRLCLYGQLLSGHILTEQMLPCQLASVIEGTRNLTLKFGQNRGTNC